MFEALSDRFEGIFSRLGRKGRLSEADIDEVLREIRVALLEADVNFKVVRGFIDRVKADLVGQDLSEALNPAQQVVKAVHQELVNTLGGETIKITYAPKPPTVVLMAGLQGSGKTTTAAKLANWFKSKGRQPLLVGADLQRPAAVDQLRTLGNQVRVPVFSEATDPVAVAKAALGEARKGGRDVVILDTAGRLAIDAEMMEQVRQISQATQPDYTFLVIDAMTGQDAVTTAEAFHETLELDGVILTKLDGDARGGAALSVKEVVGRPIAFASTGEKVKDFDLFHPDRLAGRILGMGDMLTLIEKAEEVFEKEEAEEAAAKLLEGDFTLEDFLDQMQQVKKMGPLGGIMKMLPGIPKEVRNTEIDDRELGRVEAIIHSMTIAERRNPDLIDSSRRERIAKGSGMQPNDVAALITQFREMQKLMKRMGGIGSKRVAKGRKGQKAKGKGGGRVTAKGTRGRIPKLDLQRELQGLPDLREQGMPGLGDPPPGGPGGGPRPGR
jgi:signal recognition particle subunit SRP54